MRYRSRPIQKKFLNARSWRETPSLHLLSFPRISFYLFPFFYLPPFRSHLFFPRLSFRSFLDFGCAGGHIGGV